MAAGQRDRSVFINCPFDPDYQPLFDALVFAILFCGFAVRSALEIVDSGEARLMKIIDLIEASRFSVHDMSRTTLDANTGLPRFNMPIELGIAIGMKHLGRARLRDHRLIVLDAAQPAERFRYQKFASDIAGTDIKVHANEPVRAIGAVRDFLSSHVSGLLPGAGAIDRARLSFEAALPAMAADAEQDHGALTYVDRLRHIVAFLGRTA